MHPVQALSNGIGNGIMDPTGTINPAALASSGVLGGPQQSGAQQPSRGVKRSRSPDNSYGDGQGDHDEDGKPRKRGRPPKGGKAAFAESPNQAPHTIPAPSPAGPAPHVQTPQLQNAPLPQTSPPRPSPAKATPPKATVLKALPTVRDHTTDQLNPEGDEYLPRETDDAGETKVTATGHPLDGRTYRCRTFFVPNRGDKLFMLATECARVLGYRDSYLLFNKNRSLFKIIATQAEKDDLIHQEILPYSYRSRQIAIVTARSMFRQFGSRLIQNGRRVRDDYWESKAKKQGFTEEDAAGEKRPGAAKAREAAAAEATAASNNNLTFSHPPTYPGGKIDPEFAGIMNPLQPFGGITAAPGVIPSVNAEPFDRRTTTDLQPRDYTGVQRPRQDISGAGLPYQDLTRPTPSGEILQQSAQTAEYNTSVGQQRKGRKEYLETIWARPHEPAIQPQQRPSTAETETAPQVTQAVESPRIPSTNAPGPSGGQYNIATPQRPGQAMVPQQYRQPQQGGHSQPSMMPSPMPQNPPLRADQMHRRPPSIGMGGQPPMSQGLPSAGMGPGGPHGQSGGHGYGQAHMWQGPPQPSPLSQQHNIQQYAPRPQPSPLPQQSPMHASPQLHHTQSSGSMHGTPVQQYATMMGDPAYPPMGQNHHYQPSPSPHQYMQHQSSAAQQPGMPGWAPGPAPPQQQGWPSY